MLAVFSRILLAALAAAPLAAPASPRPDDVRDATATDTTARCILPSLHCPDALCDDTDLRSEASELRALIERDFAHNYTVRLTASKSWRPLEHFGDCDNKLRIYNPKVGVAVSYRF